jgi:uncharacterized delta-60 repeat protein
MNGTRHRPRRRDDEAYTPLLPDGGVVAVGRTDAAGFTHTDFGVVRYRPGGTPDPGFDADGIVTTDILGGGDQANAVAVQPDGKTVVAGFALRNGIDGDFAVVRYNADGTRDQSFGTDGTVTTDLGTRGDDARALVIEPDGRSWSPGPRTRTLRSCATPPAGPAMARSATTARRSPISAPTTSRRASP